MEAGQSQPLLRFEKQELDQGHINDIMSSSDRQIWLSTQDGLTKYNSSQWFTYRHSPEDKNSIPNNYIWLSYEDNERNIWVGTFGGGLSRYNKILDQFDNFIIDEEYLNFHQTNSIRSIVQLDTTQLAIGTDDGLHIFDLTEDRIITDSLFIERQRKNGISHFHYLVKVDENRILAAGENGSYLVDYHSGTIQPFALEDLSHKELLSVFRIADLIYIYAGEQILVLNTQLDILHTFLAENALVTDIQILDSLHFAATSMSGLYVYNINKPADFQKYPDEYLPDTGLDDGIIFGIEEIEQGFFWLAAKTGLFKFSYRKSPFTVIGTEQLCNSSALGITNDKYSNLWVATRKGLARILNFDQSPEYWGYECLSTENAPQLKNDYILNILSDHDTLWIAYRNIGIQKARLSANGIQEVLDISPGLEQLTNSFSVSVIKKIHNRIWIGTSGNGLIIYDPSSGEVDHIEAVEGDSTTLSHSFVFDIEQLAHDSVAIATANGGITLFVPSDGTIQWVKNSNANPNSLSNNMVLDVFRDSLQRRWVATASGLNLWRDDNSCRRILRSHGLPNEVVYGIKDFEDEIWISTNKGISRIRLNDSDQIDISNYSAIDGIQGDEHNQHSHYKLADGRLIFGGKNGITCFHPRDIQNNPVQAVPQLTGFYLFNQPAGEFLDSSIMYKRRLILDYDQNFISFDLSAGSFRTPVKNRFKYRMKELSDQWISLGTRDHLAFNGLTPGDYSLQIKASNNDGIFSDKIRRLNICILKPLWLRWYALLFYSFIAGGIVYWLYRMRLSNLQQVQKAKMEEREMIRKRTARDFHDEAGSYITKISLISEMGKRKLNDPTQMDSLFSKLDANIEALRSGMKDFIWVIDPSNDSLYNTLVHIKKYILDAIDMTDISLNMSVDQSQFESINLNGEQRRQLFLIFKEIVNNSVKHSNCSRIFVDAEVSGKNEILIKIGDNGKGFQPGNKSDSGFGLRNIESRASKLKATLNIESAPGKGTLFKIQFNPDQSE